MMFYSILVINIIIVFNVLGNKQNWSLFCIHLIKSTEVSQESGQGSYKRIKSTVVSQESGQGSYKRIKSTVVSQQAEQTSF